MNRGVVVEQDPQSTVLLTPEGEFVRIRARRGAAVGQELEWSEADRLPSVRRAARARPRMAAGTFAAVILLLVAAFWFYRPSPVVAYVSMDINPSIELGLDAKARVRELNALSPDAAALTDGIAFQGKQAEEVMRILAQRLAEADLLKPDSGEIVIASVRLHTVDESWETQVIDKLTSTLQQAGSGAESGEAAPLAIETVYLPAEIRKEAQAQGISAGKMAFWLAAESEGIDVSLEELKEKPVDAIASNLGGVKKVLKDSRIAKDDKSSWNEMLKQQKKEEEREEKAKKQEEKARKQEEKSRKKTPSDDDSAGGKKRQKDRKGNHGDDDRIGKDRRGQNRNNDNREMSRNEDRRSAVSGKQDGDQNRKPGRNNRGGPNERNKADDSHRGEDDHGKKGEKNNRKNGNHRHEDEDLDKSGGR